jgi:hypothetical protein
VLAGLTCLCVMDWLVASEVAARSDPRVTGGSEAPEPRSRLAVAPSQLMAALPVGEQSSYGLTISNTGLSNTLNYTIATLPYVPLAGIVDWLEVAPRQGSVPSDSHVSIDVTFIPREDMAEGSLHQASLLVDSDALTEPISLTVPVFLEVTSPSPLRADPTSLVAEMRVGETRVHTLTLENEGESGASLSLSIRSARSATDAVAWLTAHPLSGSLASGQSMVVTATFDARDMPGGSHLAALVFETESASVSQKTVPVEMQVLPWTAYLPLVIKVPKS